MKPYAPVPYSDFSMEEPQASYLSAIVTVREALPGSAPVIIGGEERHTAEVIQSVNPASPANQHRRRRHLRRSLPTSIAGSHENERGGRPS